MKTRINGYRKSKRNEITKEVEDILYFYPESYLNNTSLENIPLNENEIICEFIIKDMGICEIMYFLEKVYYCKRS